MSPFHQENEELSRRYFLQLGMAGVAAGSALHGATATFANQPVRQPGPDKAGAEANPYFTSVNNFRDVSRGKPIPHTLSEEEKQNVGLTRDTWKLEVISDPDHPARLRRPLTVADGTALTFEALLQLGEQARSGRQQRSLTTDDTPSSLQFPVPFEGSGRQP